MNPDELAAKGNEHSHQAALFCWANMAASYGFSAAKDMLCYSDQELAKFKSLVCPPMPILKLLFAIPNGGQRHKAVASSLKAEGVKPGVPDVMLPTPRLGYHGLFIEMKKLNKGRTSDKQDNWIAALQMQGYCVMVAYTWRQAATYIVGYLNNSREMLLTEDTNATSLTIPK